jgi:uncharacterized membrane protein YcaP (DUF421 family)
MREGMSRDTLQSMFFQGWSGLLRPLVVGVLTYVALVALLRISGKRTLSKMNAFDLVVTVALGSTLATILLSDKVAITEGIVGLVVLVGLQYIVAWLSARSATVSRLVKAEPTLLLHRGMFLRGAMLRERVTEDEVLAAMRQQGVADVSKVEAVVLETDGSFTVVERPAESGQSTLDRVAWQDGQAR